MYRFREHPILFRLIVDDNRDTPIIQYFRAWLQAVTNPKCLAAAFIFIDREYVVIRRYVPIFFKKTE